MTNTASPALDSIATRGLLESALRPTKVETRGRVVAASNRASDTDAYAEMSRDTVDLPSLRNQCQLV